MIRICWVEIFSKIDKRTNTLIRYSRVATNRHLGQGPHCLVQGEISDDCSTLFIFRKRWVVFNVAAATSQCVSEQLREASATVIIIKVGIIVMLQFE